MTSPTAPERLNRNLLDEWDRSSVSEQWPRGLINLAGIMLTMTMLVWGAIVSNRNPQSTLVRRAIPYMVAAYLTFIIAVGLLAS